MYKILIHVPIYNNYRLFWESFHSLDTRGLKVDYLLTEANEVEPEIDKTGNYVSRDIIKNLPIKMEKARKLCLEGGYDYLFNLEDDHIFPPHTLKYLLSFKKEVVSAVYRLRPTKHKQAPLAATRHSDKKWVTNEDLEKHKPLLKCHLVPWGCLLVHRSVLEKIEFTSGMDGMFAHKLEELNIDRWLAVDLRIVHIDRDGSLIHV